MFSQVKVNWISFLMAYLVFYWIKLVRVFLSLKKLWFSNQKVEIGILAHIS